MINKKKQLSKLRMPTRKPGLDLSDLTSHEDSETPDEEANESPEEEKMEDTLGSDEHDSENQDPNAESGDEGSGVDSHLDDCSDDELLAEIKKRGLLSQLQGRKGTPDAHGNQDLDDNDMDHSIL